MPRPNFYQSLHTSVISEDGMPFEVQIRTEEMHKMAEEGIAAHWKYKDGPVSAQDEQRLAWLRQVVEWQRDVSDPSEFLSTLKIDLYPEEVYTFTPKGKVVVPRFLSHRLRLFRPHRSRAQLRWRQSKRAHGSAPFQVAQRRHR
jgi:GTP pyrophosphokinase